MGDRCSMSLHCRKGDEAVFESIGFLEQGESDLVPGAVEMHDEEANYGHADDLSNLDGKGVPFIASHDSGCDYGPVLFACDGRQVISISCDHDGTPTIRVDKEGNPLTGDLNLSREYYRVLKRAKKMIRCPSENRKVAKVEITIELSNGHQTVALNPITHDVRKTSLHTRADPLKISSVTLVLRDENDLVIKECEREKLA